MKTEAQVDEERSEPPDMILTPSPRATMRPPPYRNAKTAALSLIGADIIRW